MIRVKRVYEPPAVEDGARYLVDRLWPRGLKKDALALEGWLKELGPSDELRHWFGHDPARWHEFQRRYTAELEGQRELWEPLVRAARHGTVTLLFGTRDEEHNNAVALRAFLERHLRR